MMFVDYDPAEFDEYVEELHPTKTVVTVKKVKSNLGGLTIENHDRRAVSMAKIGERLKPLEREESAMESDGDKDSNAESDLFS